MYDRVAIQQEGDQPNRPPVLEREPERAAEDDQVTIIDLDQADPAGRSTCSWLAATILKWQRLPQRRYRRLAWLPRFLLGLLVVLLMSSPLCLSRASQRLSCPHSILLHPCYLFLQVHLE